MAKIAPTVRNRKFVRAAPQRRAMGGDPFASAFYNAISAAITRGEQFFIETLHPFRDRVPPELGRQIADFVAQEAVHKREHERFNRWNGEAGYDLTELQAQVERRLAPIRDKPEVVSIAATMGLEHITAVFAHELLRDPRHLASADEQTREMWRWHAAEEIEHKGVAFDTWMHVTRDWSDWKRWSVRCKVMLLVTRNFMLDRTRGMIELLRQDGITGPTAMARLFWFSFVAPGMMRQMWRGWFGFFRPGFHPWDHDDSELVIAYLAEPRDEAAPAPAVVPQARRLAA